jgi:hypothetical protein
LRCLLAASTHNTKPLILIDGGAHSGIFSQTVLSLDSNPSLQVHAFEPAPETFSKLVRKTPADHPDPGI